ncbi:MAG TPA: TonB-dependent receptor [Gemmatimonadaceae bacterium]|nr:TonB-dependent receptor [Gemmatimonadaceae bacterium]
MSRSRFAPAFVVLSMLSSGIPAARAQVPLAPGIITGRVIDEKSAQPLSEVTVQIIGQEVVGTKLAAYTGMDGRYRLVNVRPGTITIQVRRIGYTPKTITGLYLEPGRTVEQDVALVPGSQQLLAMVVSADRERATTAEAIESQRMALGVVNSITREQIQKSPDGDAAQVSRRLGSVAIDEGKMSFRGLGPRYTTTSLNGSRAPSPDPEQKSVPLDLFPSGLLDGITVSKTFTPDQPGDFSGAQVEIRTRDFPADRTSTFTLGSGMNAGALGRSLPVAPGVGGESFAFAGSGRSLPGIVRAAGDLSQTTFAERNAMINSFRNIWQAPLGGAQPNASMSATFGGSDLAGGHRFGYIAAGTYSLTRDVRLGEYRALARASGVPGEIEPYNGFSGMTAGSSALWGGVLNLSTLAGSHSRLQLNNTYNRTADNSARIERGFYEDLSIPVAIERMDYVERSVWSSQLIGEREKGLDKLRVSVTGAGVSRTQPDRSELVRQIVTDPAGTERQLWVNTLPEAAARTFADLREHSVETAVDFQHRFGDPSTAPSIKVGVLGRMVDRDAATRAYGIYSFTMTDDVRALPPEILFGGQYTAPDSTVLSLRSLAQGGSYTASDHLGAGYGMFDRRFGDRWRLTTGARYEFSLARVNATSTLNEKSTARRLFHDVLPAVALTYTPGSRQNLRLSATRTLARPEYRELAAIRTRDVLGGVDVRGNPELVRTLIDNADVRWEFYPERGEVLSVGVFAKKFHDPIERVFLASNTNSLVTYLNAAAGSDIGLELEARRSLRFLADALAPFTAFGNATLMRSRVDLGSRATTATNPARAMAGQAPYIVNGGLTWTALDGDLSATALFNRIGDRIVSAGELPLPDVIADGGSTLDFSLRFPVIRGISGRFDAKNLLDSPMIERQGSVIRERYTTGRVFQAAFTWR